MWLLRETWERISFPLHMCASAFLCVLAQEKIAVKYLLFLVLLEAHALLHNKMEHSILACQIVKNTIHKLLVLPKVEFWITRKADEFCMHN